MPERIEMPPDVPRELNTIERAVLEGDIMEAIRTIYDPEIPVNIWDLGLIYDIQIDNDRNVNVVMTLTSPACPVAESLPGDVQRVVQQVATVKHATVELTWDPPFSIDRMSQDVQLMLGLI
ncbi:MAG: iron-sulfur cluster assembly protein [Fimbriimonadaceae bacterium]